MLSGRRRRQGSLDGNIRDHSPNALRNLVRGLPALRLIAFNGNTSSAIGRKGLGELTGVGDAVPAIEQRRLHLGLRRKAGAVAAIEELSMTADDVLDFWFADETRPKWFQSTPEFDDLIRERFGDLYQEAAAGGLDGLDGKPAFGFGADHRARSVFA